MPIYSSKGYLRQEENLAFKVVHSAAISAQDFCTLSGGGCVGGVCGGAAKLALPSHLPHDIDEFCFVKQEKKKKRNIKGSVKG